MSNWCLPISYIKTGWDKIAKKIDNDSDKDGNLCYSDMPQEIQEHEFRDFLDNIKKTKRKLIANLNFYSGKGNRIKQSQVKRFKEIADIFKKHPLYNNKNIKLVISCHTDSSGKPSENMKLTRERAEFIGFKIVLQGIPSEKIETKGFGDTRPNAPNNTAKNRAINNRTEFIIVFAPIFIRK